MSPSPSAPPTTAEIDALAQATVSRPIAPPAAAPPSPASLRTDPLITNEMRNKLRKTKTVPAAVKQAVYAGNIGGIGPTVQFNQDVAVYGLYEALLYVEGYERQKLYKPGTALRAAYAACKIKAVVQS